MTKRAFGFWTVLVLPVVIVAIVLMVEADRRSPADFWSIAVPGVLTGVGTLMLALVTVILAYQDRRRDDLARKEERRRNDRSLAESRERETAREHRAQAEGIAAWTPGRHRQVVLDGVIIEGGVAVEIANPSAQPVYDVLVFQVFTQGAAPSRGEDWMASRFAEQRFKVFMALPSIPPGKWSIELEWTPPPPQGVLGIEIAFTDRSGSTWVRRATGALEELTLAAPEHYGLGRPFPYGQLSPAYREANSI